MRLSVAIVVAVAAAGGAAAAAAQQPGDAQRGYASREALEELLQLYEQSAQSPAYSEALRSRSRFEANLIRERLERGDFQVGDRILLTVEGEPAFSDTFIVAEGPVLQIPTMRDIRLGGVLRSELEAHLRNEIGQVLRDPQVKSRSLIRISIVGAVTRPGFYTTPSEALVSDALMLAGGPTPAGRVNDIAIERGGRRIWAGDALQQAIIEGRTLDQLSVRAGDRIVVPERGRGLGGAEAAVRTVSILLSLPLTIFALTRVF